MMRKRLYHNKARSIVSYRLDDIQQQCRNTTSYRQVQTNTSKQLLLQNYETYRKKAKTAREQKLFLSRTSPAPNKVINRTFSSKINKRSSSSKDQNLINSCNYMSASLNRSSCNFFQTEYPTYRDKTLRNIDFGSIQIQFNVFETFLSDLYAQKVKDLKIPVNQRQKKMFIMRLKEKVNQKQIVAIGCDLGYNSICTVSYYLAKKPPVNEIKSLVLDQNNIGDKGIIKLATSLTNCKNLKKLSLASVNLGTSGSEYLFRALIGHQNLEILNLSSSETQGRNKIGTTPINIFKEVLRNQKCKIKSINLANTCLGSDGFYLLCCGLIHFPNELELLNVSSNQIRIKEEDLPKIRSKLQNTRIKRFELQDNILQNMGASLISYLLGIKYGQNEISKTTLYVDLSSNGIKSRGLQSLCMSLSQNHKIQELYLANNRLSEGESFYTIRSLLIHNWSITKLSLRKSIHESTNLKYIAEGLDKNRSLRWLDLSQNKFPPAVFGHFFNNISQNTSMRTLKMDSCEISDEHIITAYACIKNNKCVQQLSLNNNYINSKGAKLILKILMDSKRICEIHLKKNCIDVHILKQISFQAKQNIAHVMNEGDPDLNYYEYAEKMQESHYNNLKRAVKDLQVKSDKLKCQTIVDSISEKSEKINQISKQIENESKMIKELQQILEEEEKRLEKGKDINFATEVDIQ